MKAFFLVLLILSLPVVVHSKSCDDLRPSGSGDRRLSPELKEDWKWMKCKAENGDTFQQYYVGIHLIGGTSHDGVNAQKGLNLITMSASKGYETAQWYLARYYLGKELVGNTLEEVHDLNKGYQWLYILSNSDKAYSELLNLYKERLSEIRKRFSEKDLQNLEREAYKLLENSR